MVVVVDYIGITPFYMLSVPCRVGSDVNAKDVDGDRPLHVLLGSYSQVSEETQVAKGKLRFVHQL